MRRLTGHDHRFLLPGTWLVGGVVLAVCDTVARTVLYPTELPVGLVTAALGAPLFLLLLLRGGTSR